MLKYPDEWAFVSLYDGLGGPPIFCGLLVDRAVGSGGFLSYACYCLCLFFLAGVGCVGDASVSSVLNPV
jgi:hypothetical protein